MLPVSCRAKKEQHTSARGGDDGDVARLARQEGLDWSTIIIIILSCRDNPSGGGNIDNTPK